MGDPRIKRLPREMRWDVHNSLCLDLERYVPEEIVQTVRTAIRGRSDKDILSISGSFGLQSITPSEVGPVTQVAATQLIARFQSKYEASANANELHRQACVKFCTVDATLRPVGLDYDTLERVRRIIARIVGSVPVMDTLYQLSKHGPGSTATISYRDRHPLNKWRESPYYISSPWTETLKQVILDDERWLDACANRPRTEAWAGFPGPLTSDVVCNVAPLDYNLLTTVPKDSARRRTICKEPTYSMYFQLGLHAHLSRRLAYTTGIDITDKALRGASRNRLLARLGSATSSIWDAPATVDLSEASDRLSLDLVYRVFPPEWTRMLDSIRSGATYLEPWLAEALGTEGLKDLFPLRDCGLLLLNKYASMGNGTTFIVQTIVYYALARVACQNAGIDGNPEIAVYGDDIVLPTFAAEHLREILHHAGLVVNVGKSFTDSRPVRESCGGDYYRGSNVRPVFYRKDYDHDLPGLLSLRNLLWLWSEELGMGLPCTLRLLDSYLCDVPAVPKQAGLTSGRWTRTYGPYGSCIGYYPVVTYQDRRPQGNRVLNDAFVGEDFCFAKMCAHLGRPDAAAFELPPMASLEARLRKNTPVYDKIVTRDSLADTQGTSASL